MSNDIPPNEIEKDIPTSDLENEGIPAVNNRYGGNLLTYLGYGGILLITGFLLYLVNSGKPEKKEVKPQKITESKNTLPKLNLKPEPITVKRKVRPSPVPAVPRPEPITTRPQARTKQQPPPVPAWITRKLKGKTLTVSSGIGKKTASAVQNPNADALNEPPQGLPDNYRPNRSENPNYTGEENQNKLEQLLKPAIVKAEKAKILPDRNFLITQGTTADCALQTAINSTLPGLISCRLARDIYSDNGQVLLLERGTKLTGQYQSGIKQGQSRLFVVFNRATTPRGVAVNLNSPGTGVLGESGMSGHVDNHFWKRFGNAILISLIDDAIVIYKEERKKDDDRTTVGAATDSSEIVKSILKQSANIPPTLVKNQGENIRITFARDLDFSDVYQLQLTQ